MHFNLYRVGPAHLRSRVFKYFGKYLQISVEWDLSLVKGIGFTDVCILFTSEIYKIVSKN